VQLFRASWLAPVSGPPLQDGVVAVAGDRVSFVGPASSADAPAGTLRDLGRGVLMPGLVNAHCHLELSALAGQVEAGRGFTAWVEDLVAARPGVPAAKMRRATGEAIRRMEAGGTAAVGDVSNALEHLDLLAASSLHSVVFFELIGWDPARAGAVLETADERLAEIASAGSNLEVRVAAHAPYSVSAALLRRLVARGGPAALHLAESLDETRFLRSGDGPLRAFLADRVGDVAFAAPGLSPVEYVAGLGVLRPGLVAAHCVQVDRADRRRLAAAGVAVAVCPRSNRTLGVGVPPVPDLLADGVLVALGTDSLASAPSLDLLDDAVALHREFPVLDPALIVRMATASAAQALGLADLGTLAPGKRAALAFAPATHAIADPLDFLLSGEARLSTVRL
jgi:cytosine/adenosine deaminase-related metal-dependent hydrolase